MLSNSAGLESVVQEEVQTIVSELQGTGSSNPAKVWTAGRQVQEGPDGMDGMDGM